LRSQISPIESRQTLDFPGPAGALEARLDAANGPVRAHAVLCHPHPLYGGTMNDAVLDCLAQTLLGSGVSCLRFNFRGVGNSGGRYDGNGGEVEDLRAAVGWLQSEHSPSQLWLGGYSFGANVVWQCLAGMPEPHRVLLIAPPVGSMSFPELDLSCPVDIFIGDADEYARQDALAAWRGVRAHTIVGANHFFLGQRETLQQRIEQAIS
jgi:alpha/beta superfamily hydrolase